MNLRADRTRGRAICRACTEGCRLLLQAYFTASTTSSAGQAEITSTAPADRGGIWSKEGSKRWPRRAAFLRRTCSL